MEDHSPGGHYEFLIVGAGFSGLGAAIRLKQEGKHSFLIFERAAELGGTWRDNIYPGCGCDVPSRLYSYSFEQNPDWSRAFSRQAEILAYLKHCATKYELYPHLRFKTTINEARFDEQQNLWQLKSKSGAQYTARFVISATGPLNRPVIPVFEGLDTFRGHYFHSSEWPEHYDLKNRKVAVIGTGASAIQIVPNIIDKVEQLHLFQRSAAWVFPKGDNFISAFKQGMYRKFPIIQRIIRGILYYFHEFRGYGFWGSKLFNSIASKIALLHMKSAIKDPELRKKLTPDYALGCKRVLPSDDYYPALARPNAKLVTEGIAAIKANGILDKNGKLHEIDTIVMATGFRAAENIVDFPVAGLNGLLLHEEWNKKGIETYYGISVSRFPNLFFMVGPNTGLGHNSIIVMIEAQMNYILDYLRKLEASGAKYFDVKADVQRLFNQQIQKDLQGTVWASGCKSWYLDSKGKNTTLWPASTIRYRKETAHINMEDFTAG